MRCQMMSLKLAMKTYEIVKVTWWEGNALVLIRTTETTCNLS